jgi:protease IV
MRAVFRILGILIGISLCLFVVIFTIIGVKRAVFGTSAEMRADHVEVMELSGVIVSSTTFLKELKEAVDASQVKAIVLRVNSPGGFVAPSQEIYEAVKRADQKKPVVVSMASLAASGGYYVALAGRKVFANPGTLTGSIGVIMEFVNMEKLYNWAKMERYTLKAGKFKDIGSPQREMKKEEKDLLNSMLADIHSQFKATVKDRRKLSDEEIEKTCDGRIFTGTQARDAKLIDEVQDIENVVLEAKKMAGLKPDAPVHYPEAKSSLFRKLFFDDDANSLFEAKLGLDPLVAAFRPGFQVLLLSPLR